MQLTKPIKCTTPKSELQCKLWTLDDYDMSPQVHQFKQMYHSGGDVDSGGDYACVEAGCMWELSVPSPQFCCEPNTALQKVLEKIVYMCIQVDQIDKQTG